MEYKLQERCYRYLISFILTIWNINGTGKTFTTNLILRFILTIWNINFPASIANKFLGIGFILTIWNINTIVISGSSPSFIVLY